MIYDIKRYDHNSSIGCPEKIYEKCEKDLLSFDD